VAKDAGFVVLDLSHAYDGHDNGEVLISAWDQHPNAFGHKLLADALYNALLANRDALHLRSPSPADK
jgi:hypothetical protein